jgi:hypothetical protein
MHAHEHAAPNPRARQYAGFSLLRVSAVQRVAIVVFALILIWSGVYWALS